MVQHTYLGNFPDERQDDWTDECQGVTHDRDHWFITQKGAVWRVPIGKDLTGPPPERRRRRPAQNDPARRV